MENEKMATKFESLEQCIDFYGRENLVAIDCLPQIIFYTAKGIQPKYVIENEVKPGRISCWFLKSESSHVYKMWAESRPMKKC
jgi:hypothetical protein